ncbi:MAG TPA: TPM domain-containing protein [Tepidisphaeraceae bacterium]|nr:TPM domain-containing protein [Tepidisphaeraceae bacterium]
MKKAIFILLALALVAGTSRSDLAAEVIPPAPAHHFNDYANVVPKQTAEALDRKLDDFEKQTSNQIVVVVYPKMQSDSSIEDYAVRVAHKWGVGQKGRDNGVVLFVFTQDRKMFIATGYGLEGALPDVTAKTIIENEIKPRFRQNDYAGGLSAGIDAILAATKGEYQALPVKKQPSGNGWGTIIFWIILIILMIAIMRRNRSATYSRYGRRGGWGPIFIPPMGGGWGRSSGGGWGGSSGGGSWGGGGGFSGGGGGFGGGGAGGSW